MLASAPFKHDIEIGGSTLASTKHLPPTLSAVYAFDPQSRYVVYAGLGVHGTLFFQESTRVALNGTRLSLDDSWGLAALVGIDVELGEKWFVNADVHYMDIDTHATVTAPGLRIKERVDIDPFAVCVNLGYRF